jgi:hypothetical protein
LCISLKVSVFPRKNRRFRGSWRKKRQLRQVERNQRLIRETLAISRICVGNAMAYCVFVSAVHNGLTSAVKSNRGFTAGGERFRDASQASKPAETGIMPARATP